MTLVSGCGPAEGDRVDATRAALAESTDTVFETSYVDRAGQVRTFTFELRVPSQRTGALAVVVYSHGKSSADADGERDPHTVGRAWGNAVVSAGHAFIAIAHAPRRRSSLDALCHALGVAAADCRADSCGSKDECRRSWPSGAPGEEKGLCVAEAPGAQGQCSYLDYLSYDRPNDAAAVFDWLDAATGPGGDFEGILDPTRLAYAGHSGGGGGTLMAAGAARRFAGVDRVVLDPRPRAFLTIAVQGPDDDNFTPEGLTGQDCLAQSKLLAVCLTRPQMFITGLGDSSDPKESWNRRRNFWLVPKGDKYLVWLTSPDARHGLFNLESGDCGSTDPTRCAQLADWVALSGLQFLEAHLNGRASDLTALRTPGAFGFTGGEVELTWR